MSVEFRRIGHVFVPKGDQPWARSHASTPFAIERPEGVLEVFFSSRDDSNRSHIGSVNLAWHDGRLLPIGEPRLVLSPGSIGTFDEHGTSMGSIIDFHGASYLYYVGWSLRTDVPWQNTIGLAIRKPGDRDFQKFAESPVLDVSETDPYSMSYPWVLRRSNQLIMWYGTNLSWGNTPTNMEHAIRRAVSTDGIHWVPDQLLCVDVDRPDEFALARPSVWTTAAGSTHHMLLSKRRRSRPDSYEFGLAVSNDGLVWTRADQLLRQGESAGRWDAEMACYAAVIHVRDDTIAVYCGNGFGRTGFGAACIDP